MKIDKNKLNRLLDEFEDFDIERGLFKIYLERTKLDFKQSEFLSNYFQDFEEVQNLRKYILELDITTFDELEHIMELLIPLNDRKLNGAFFTPKYIVDFIIEEISPNEDSKVLDPSCGCGAFLLGIIRYYENNNRTISEIVKNNVYGADILDYNIRRSKLLITIYALERGEILRSKDFNIYLKDSLRDEWKINFDAVVGNPPYVKFQDLSDSNRVFLKEKWQTINKGTYNIYFAFFELGYRILKKTGKLGYITPNNYFTSLAGESLRNYFSSNQCIYKIIDFNHYKIFDAQTYTCLTFLNKSKNQQISFDKLYGSNPIEFLESYDKSEIKLEDLNDKKWRLLRESEQFNIKKIENTGIRLNELFVINVGIATLKDILYFIDGKSIDSDYYIKTYNNREYKIEKEIVKPLYKISDFSNQKECDSNYRKIIYPYRIENGKAVVLEEADLANRFPMTYKYLIDIKLELIKRSKDEINPFYLYGRSQGLNKFGIRLLTPTFSKRPKFLVVEEFDSLYCNGYGLHYKEDFNNGLGLFDNRPIQRKENIDVLQKILNSELMHYYVTHTSVSIQGGYPCYQKNFIERFRIPDLDENEINLIRNLKFDELNVFLAEKYQVKLGIPNLV